MITIITGAPGAGKSAALVDLLSELSKSRTVYVSGIPDLKIPHEPLDDPTTWTSDVPDGSIIVIDEVQRVWRPRGPGQKVPPDIAALETHRHRALDFYIVTQAPGLIDSNVRRLAGRHIHLRDIGVLGRWWYEWPECCDNCATAWKNAPIKKKYALPKRIFDQYKSASEHIKPIRSFPFMLIVLALAVVLLLGFGWRVYTIIRDRGHLPVTAPAAAPAAAPGQPSQIPVSAPPGRMMAAGWTAKSFEPVDPVHPESAPAYDEIRKVRQMPVVVGGFCVGNDCHCLNQQGLDAGLDEMQCKRWLMSPPFNPYRSDQVADARDNHRQDSPPPPP